REHFELPFFNYFLKDKGDISQIKEINVFDTGANQWRDLTSWSPPNSRAYTICLEGNAQIRFGDGVQGKCPPTGGPKPPRTGNGAAGNVAYDEYVSDPMNPVPYTQKITLNYPRDFMTEDQRFAATRPDVLVYQTEPLTEDIMVAGSIKPEIFISSSGT